MSKTMRLPALTFILKQKLFIQCHHIPMMQEGEYHYYFMKTVAAHVYYFAELVDMKQKSVCG